MGEHHSVCEIHVHSGLLEFVRAFRFAERLNRAPGQKSDSDL
jgi:hypothetical protein